MFLAAVTFRFNVSGDTDASAILVLDAAIAFQPRDASVRELGSDAVRRRRA